ncbi:head-tail adaptor protein [Psychromarinibacter halotolerans]|uniref:head-tail adaptor protein n=1 Tax=Psychromarinibacter halotolerans TaxID=1775175 RepID=UPI0026A0B35A
MHLGRCRERVAFDEPVSTSDGSGGQEAGFSEVFKTPAHFRYLRGGETVQAARLEGRQPVVVTVPATPRARRITTDWRMRDINRVTYASDGSAVLGVYAVKAPPVLSEDRAWLEITCETGVGY